MGQGRNCRAGVGIWVLELKLKHQRAEAEMKILPRSRSSFIWQHQEDAELEQKHQSWWSLWSWNHCSAGTGLCVCDRNYGARITTVGMELESGKGSEGHANPCLTLLTFPLPLLIPFLASPTPPSRPSPTHGCSLELYFHQMAAWLCSC